MSERASQDRAALPNFIPPELATLVDNAPEGAHVLGAVYPETYFSRYLLHALPGGFAAATAALMHRLIPCGISGFHHFLLIGLFPRSSRSFALPPFVKSLQHREEGGDE